MDSSEMRELFEPNLYLYDAYPGGIGFSEPLYRTCDVLLARTCELIAACSCENGCPSCVGPAGERSQRAKEAALAILGQLCSGNRERWKGSPYFPNLITVMLSCLNMYLNSEAATGIDASLG